VLSSLNFLLRGARYHYYLRTVGVSIPFAESVLVFLAGLLMTVTPGKVGEFFKSFLLKWTRDRPLRVTSPVIVAERFADLVAMLLLAAWGGLSTPQGLLLGLTILAVAAAVLALGIREEIGLLVLAGLERIGPIKRFVPKLRDAYVSLHSILHLKPLVVGLALGLVAWWLQVETLREVVKGFGAPPLAAQPAAFVYCGSLIVGVLALLPGGIGVTEAGMTGLLRFVSGGALSPALATAVTLTVRVATLWWAVAVGLVATLIHRRITGWELRPRSP
jgi:glycosyltransferase 2 family protein